MEKFATELGITHPGEQIGDTYVIPLMNSNEYSQVYTILDKSDKVELDSSCTLVSEQVSELTYYNDEYEVKLDANFDDDFYRVVIKPNKED